MTTTVDILEDVRADGVHLVLSPTGTIKATGDSAAVNRWVPVLRAHKREIVAALRAGAGGTVFGWRLHFDNRDPVEVAFAPPVDHAGALASYPDAIAAEPIPEPPAVPIPADLAALFDACALAGLYDDADRAALPAMLGLDPEATRELIEAMHSRIGRCRRCRHFRQPGKSDGCCTGRDDLPHVYGFMHELPADGGARCDAFDEGRGR